MLLGMGMVSIHAIYLSTIHNTGDVDGYNSYYERYVYDVYDRRYEIREYEIL